MSGSACPSFWPDHPGAAVDLEEHRRPGVVGRSARFHTSSWLRIAGVAVADVAGGAVALARPHVGPQQLPAGERHLGLRAERLPDAAPVVGAELVDERRFEDRARARARSDGARRAPPGTPRTRRCRASRANRASLRCRASSAPVASSNSAVWIGSSDTGSPNANAGMESGPVRPAGRRALAVCAAATAPPIRKRVFVCISPSCPTAAPHCEAGRHARVVSLQKWVSRQKLIDEDVRQPPLVPLGLPAFVDDEQAVHLGGHERVDDVGGIARRSSGRNAPERDNERAISPWPCCR